MSHIHLFVASPYMFVSFFHLQENDLKVSSWRERLFDFLKIKDPFEPKIPEHLVRDVYFTAPFKLERKEK